MYLYSFSEGSQHVPETRKFKPSLIYGASEAASGEACIPRPLDAFSADFPHSLHFRKLQTKALLEMASYYGFVFGQLSQRCKNSNVPWPWMVCGPTNHSICVRSGRCSRAAYKWRTLAYS